MNIFGIFATGVVIGLFLDLILQEFFRLFLGKKLKRNHLYHLFQNVNVFIPALAGIMMLILKGSALSIKIFIVSSFLGAFLEYLVGKILCFFHGKPVWEYDYLPIGKFTSWVSVLYWGGVGLLFVRIANFVENYL